MQLQKRIYIQVEVYKHIRYAQGVQRQRPDKKGIDKTPPKEE